MSTTLIEVRQAKMSDAASVAATHDQAWRFTYQGIIPGAELDKLINRRGPLWWESAIRKGSRVSVLVFGDKVASNLISAGIGSLSGTMTELVKDDAFKKLYSEDKKAFGLELAKRGGKHFAIALGAAWGTAKLEEWLPAGFKWLAKLPVISDILKKFAG